MKISQRCVYIAVSSDLQGCALGVLVYKTHTTDFVIIDVPILAPTPAPTADSAHIT